MNPLDVFAKTKQNGKNRKSSSKSNKKRFACDDCSASFTCQSHLVSHIRVHTGEKPFKCPTCGKGFSQKCSVKVHHRLVHEKLKPFKCEFCSARFGMRHGLNSHMLVHTKEKAFQCHFCQMKFAHRSSLNSHITIHTGEKPYQCNICGISFRESPSLRDHLRRHKGEKPFKCEHCLKAFTTSTELRIHTSLKHTGYQHIASCIFCNKLVRTKTELEQHIRSHVEEKPFFCAICENSFAQSGALKAHMTVHSNSRPFSCQFCDMKFRRAGTKIQHEARHRLGHVEKTHKCDICEKCFATPEYLQTHTSYVHVGSKKFKCQLCGQGCPSKYRLAVHMRVHTNERPYRCDFCELTFKQPGAKRKHEARHLAQGRHFKCSKCDKTYTTEEQLKKHVHFAHVRDMLCVFCVDKRFNSQEGLWGHLISHTGEKPLFCGICKAEFAYSAARFRHFKNVHGIDKPKITSVTVFQNKD